MSPTDPAQYSECLISPKRVRGLRDGRYLVDSRRALLARRDGRPPVYYFPKADIDMGSLEASPTAPAGHADGCTRFWDLVTPDTRIAHAAWEHLDVPPDVARLEDHVAFAWTAMDAWFEEEEQVYVHPRDPHVRVDALRSSRHIRIVLGGETLADSRCPVLLFETGLPTRYYLPKTQVRMELLEPSGHVTHCPYKGEARYYSVRLARRTEENIVWYYPHPNPEVMNIAGLVCFYTERLDTVFLDGEPATS